MPPAVAARKSRAASVPGGSSSTLRLAAHEPELQLERARLAQQVDLGERVRAEREPAPAATSRSAGTTPSPRFRSVSGHAHTVARAAPIARTSSSSR